MARFSMFYPVKPFKINQNFGDNTGCVKNFQQPTQQFATGNYGSCPAGFQSLYKLIGMLGHNGEDLAAYHGQPVYAPIDGIITEVQMEAARGIGVGITTNDRVDLDGNGTHFVKVRLWHLLDISVKIGQQVKVGDLVGHANNTGYSSGDHLHVEPKAVEKNPNGDWINVNPVHLCSSIHPVQDERSIPPWSISAHHSIRKGEPDSRTIYTKILISQIFFI